MRVVYGELVVWPCDVCEPLYVHVRPTSHGKKRWSEPPAASPAASFAPSACDASGAVDGPPSHAVPASAPLVLPPLPPGANGEVPGPPDVPPGPEVDEAEHPATRTAARLVCRR